MLCHLIHNYSPLHFQLHILIKLCKNSVIGFCSHYCFPVFSFSISLQLCYYSAHFHSSLIHLTYGVLTMWQLPYCRSRSRDTEESQPWFPTQRKEEAGRQINSYKLMWKSFLNMIMGTETVIATSSWERDQRSTTECVVILGRSWKMNKSGKGDVCRYKHLCNERSQERVTWLTEPFLICPHLPLWSALCTGFFVDPCPSSSLLLNLDNFVGFFCQSHCLC